MPASPSPPSQQVRDGTLLAQRRAAIARACVPLFHRQGYHATTTRQIAAAAGMTMGGLYLYIREKSDCLRIILDSIHDDVVALGSSVSDDGEVPDALGALVVEVVLGMHRHRREILVLDRARDVLIATAADAALGYEQQVVGRIERLLRRGLDDGSLSLDADPGRAALGIFWQCGLWVHRFERLRGETDPARFAAEQADLLLRGLRAR